MVHGVKVHQQPRRAEGAPGQQERPVFPGIGAEALPLPRQDGGGHDEGDEVAEKALLEGGEVSRQADEGRHAGKAERR